MTVIGNGSAHPGTTVRQYTRLECIFCANCTSIGVSFMSILGMRAQLTAVEENCIQARQNSPRRATTRGGPAVRLFLGEERGFAGGDQDWAGESSHEKGGYWSPEESGSLWSIEVSPDLWAARRENQGASRRMRSGLIRAHSAVRRLDS